MMKKLIALVLILTISALCFLASCRENPGDKENSDGEIIKDDENNDITDITEEDSNGILNEDNIDPNGWTTVD